MVRDGGRERSRQSRSWVAEEGDRASELVEGLSGEERNGRDHFLFHFYLFHLVISLFKLINISTRASGINRACNANSIL